MGPAASLEHQGCIHQAGIGEDSHCFPKTDVAIVHSVVTYVACLAKEVDENGLKIPQGG